MMRSRILNVISLLVLGLFLISACNITIPGLEVMRGSGNLVTEAREVSNFDQVSLRGFGEVAITQSGEESLIVETDDNVMPHITTRVQGKTLILGYDTTQVRLMSPTQLKFTLNVKDLSGLEISGSGDIAMPELETDRLDVDISGSGDLQIDTLMADKVAVKISGSGDVTLEGEATAQDIIIRGSGKYHAGDLRSEAVEVAISGSGDVTVWATDTLDGRISGSGTVRCYGNPRTSVSSSGSGEVIHIGQK